jgi:hypothetical protein
MPIACDVAHLVHQGFLKRLPGHVWQITCRCHKREFLLKFSKDCHRWIELL